MNAWESMNFHTLSAHISTLKGTTGRGMREETERDRENERKEERNVTRRAENLFLQSAKCCTHAGTH